jgi:hypothetical protein
MLLILMNLLSKIHGTRNSTQKLCTKGQFYLE